MADRIQLRGGTAALCASVNEVLALLEPCYEIDTLKYKIGDGVTAWNALPYAGQFTLANATDVVFTNIAEPTTPAADTVKLFFRKIAGRMRAFIKGPSGLATMLGTDPATNFAFRVMPNVTTSVTVLGNTGVGVGTLSHPAPTEALGYMTNFISAATANATCGYSCTTSMFLRGSVVGANGFEFSNRLAFPDASYDQTAVTTGTRIFVGMPMCPSAAKEHIMQTSSKTTPKNDPLAAFIAAKAEIDAHLARLAAISANHFNMAPDDIQWGHVTVLHDTLATLRTLHA